MIIVAAEKTIVIDSLAINVRWVAGFFTPVSKKVQTRPGNAVQDVMRIERCSNTRQSRKQVSYTTLI